MRCVQGRIPNTTADASHNTRLLRSLSSETRVLDLRWVPLYHLEVAHLQELEELYLHENGLRSLGDSIASLPKIRVLSLGRNNIQSLPFAEDDMVLEHGSIGSNPLVEPVGSCWMFRKDAQQSIMDIQRLLRPTIRLPFELEERNIEIAIDICRSLDEPMIYEGLYAGYRWCAGAITHPEHEHLLERKVLTQLLPLLKPDVLLSRSLAEQLRCH